MVGSEDVGEMLHRLELEGDRVEVVLVGAHVLDLPEGVALAGLGHAEDGTDDLGAKTPLTHHPVQHVLGDLLLDECMLLRVEHGVAFTQCTTVLADATPYRDPWAHGEVVAQHVLGPVRKPGQAFPLRTLGCPVRHAGLPVERLKEPGRGVEDHPLGWEGARAQGDELVHGREHDSKRRDVVVEVVDRSAPVVTDPKVLAIHECGVDAV